MTTFDERAADFLDVCRRDFDFFCRACLQIRVLHDGAWTFVPFVLNAEQRAIVRHFLDCEGRRRPFRLLLLKARKRGATTVLIALMYWMAIFRKNFHTLTTAHLKESVLVIADIATGFNDHLPAPVAALWRAVPHHGGLRWAHGSNHRVITARSDDVLRGSTPAAILYSEAAFYDRNRRKTTALDFLASAMGSIDYRYGTYQAMETTSHGPAGTFYDRWLLSMDKLTAGGEPVWRPMFFDWQSSCDYAFEVLEEDARLDAELRAADAGDAPGAAQEAAKALGYDALWARRALDFRLTPPQVRWAMAMTDGDYNGDHVLFDRNFPVSWQIAFSSASRTVIAGAVLEAWKDRPVPETTVVGAWLREAPGGIVLDPGGDRWEVYLPPVPWHEYTVGIDASAGAGQDRGAIEVKDRHTGEQVAEFYCATTPPDVLAEQAVLACRRFNDAMAMPEVNNHGAVVLRRMLDLGHRRIHRDPSARAPRAGASWLRQLGFETHSGNREALFDDFAEAVRKGRFVPCSRRLLREAETFVRDDKDRADHLPGCHSDALTAAALADLCDRALPPPAPAPGPERQATALDRHIAEWRKAVGKKAKRKYRGNGWMELIR